MIPVIVAKQPGERFLVHTAGNPKDETGMARILDVDTGTYWPAFPIQSILARGYWEEYIPAEGELEELLDRVKAGE